MNTGRGRFALAFCIHDFGALSTTSQVPFSSFIFKRRQTSLLLNSPKHANSNPNNLDEYIAHAVRGSFILGATVPSSKNTVYQAAHKSHFNCQLGSSVCTTWLCGDFSCLENMMHQHQNWIKLSNVHLHKSLSLVLRGSMFWKMSVNSQSENHLVARLQDKFVKHSKHLKLASRQKWVKEAK